MAKIKVTTFRGFASFDTIESAQQGAKDMIMDIITDGFPVEKWWARVNWYEFNVYRLWLSPKLGFWAYSEWLPLQLDLFDN